MPAPEKKRRPRFLIVCNDVVDVKMAGPGMRYLEMARILKNELDVTLAVPSETSLQEPGIPLVPYALNSPESLKALVDNSDVALVSGHMVRQFPFLATTPTRLVVDMINPFLLEHLHYNPDTPIEFQTMALRGAVEDTNDLARTGDYFVCGSERQRDFWMGVLAANGRINPLTHGEDDTLRNLISVVGFGIPEQPPVRRHPVLRGVNPAFGEDTKIVWWGGGMWDWLDSVTMIEAWPAVLARHPEARLVFLRQHPNPRIPRHKKAERTMRIAEELGEVDRSVFFLEWLSYLDCETMLCEADVGVVLHPLHVETHFSARTRIYNFIWARLPILVSDGDVMSELVRERGLGRVAPPSDPDGVALALSELLDKPKTAWQDSFEELTDCLRWSRVVSPLREYVLTGGQAADRQRECYPFFGQDFLRKLGKARNIWREAGLFAVFKRALVHIRWLAIGR
jgi:glycosyltransferase involved in cell wall biosynthesis